MKLSISGIMLASAALAACPANVPPGVITCYYADYAGGNDANNGTSEATPWKRIPNMVGYAGGHMPVAGDGYIMKGGSVWPNTVWPISVWNISGTSSHPIYIGYDPAWNAGTLVSVKPTSSGYHCSAISVGLSGGGGSSAAATANFQTSNYLAGLLQHVTLTNAGSGYTSNPAVSFAGSSCTTLPTAVADIQSPVWDFSGTIWNESNGSVANKGPLYFFANYIVLDHIDFRNMAVDHTIAAGSIQINLLTMVGNGTVVENAYLHNFGPDVVETSGTPSFSGTGATDFNQGYSGNYATFTNSFIDDYETEVFVSCGYNGSTAASLPPPCGTSSGVANANLVTNNIVHDTRGMVYGPSVAQNNDFHGNVMWDTVHDCCGQHEDAFYFFGGGVVYDNILHDLADGAAAFYIELSDGNGNCNATSIFNNVIWNVGSSTPPVGHSAEFYTSACNGADGVTTPTMNDYNNTLYSLDGTRDCINWGQQQTQSAAVFSLYNNFCISDQTVSHWYDSNGSSYGTADGQPNPNSSGTRVIVDASNTILSPSTASSQGYTISNQFAPIAPTDSTVTFSGSDFASSCSGMLIPLCMSLNGIPRPNTGGWPSGAYTIAGALGVTTPPTAVGIVSQ